MVVLAAATDPAARLEIAIESPVAALYGEAIRAVVAQTLAAAGIGLGVKAQVTDRGALDYVLRARTAAAAQRWTKLPAAGPAEKRAGA